MGGWRDSEYGYGWPAWVRHSCGHLLRVEDAYDRDVQQNPDHYFYSGVEFIARVVPRLRLWRCPGCGEDLYAGARFTFVSEAEVRRLERALGRE